MDLKFNKHYSEDDVDGELLFLEGDCGVCHKPNSLILMNDKKLRKYKIKLYIKCISCFRKFECTAEFYND